MQIGVLIPRISLGGASKVALNQVKYFRAAGFNAYLLTLASEKVRSVPHRVIGIGAHIKAPFLRTSIPMLISTIWGLYLNHPRVDILIAHGLSSITALRLKEKYNIPYITYIHHPNAFLYGKSIHPKEEESTLGPLSRYPLKILWNKRTLAYLDIKSIKESLCVLTNSRYVLGKLNELYGNITAKVCYPAIDNDYHRVKPRLECKEDLAVYVSRHVIQKGLHLIPIILSKVESKITLILAGKPTKLTRIVIEKIHRLGLRKRVIIRTNMSKNDLIKTYIRAKILLFPAIKEDFGISPIEGMATGAIPVAWKDGGGVEETIVNFRTGLLASPYDINDYARKMDLLITDKKLYSRMVYNAKAFSRNFSWEKHVRTILEIIRDISMFCCK